MIKTNKKIENQKKIMQLKNSHEFDLSVTDGKGRVYEIEPKGFDDQKREQMTFKLKSNFINENKLNFDDDNKRDLLLMAQSNQSGEEMRKSQINTSYEVASDKYSNAVIFNIPVNSYKKLDKPLIEAKKESDVKIDEHFYKIYGHMTRFGDEDSFYFKEDKPNDENAILQTNKNSNLYKNKKY
jgi:hypothetical protein